jgi:hypothetical protein
MEWALPTAIAVSQADSPLIGPADAVAGAILISAWLYDHYPDPDDVQGITSGPCTAETGKSDRHANQDAKESARRKYEEAKKKFEDQKSKPNKTPADKELQKQLQKEMEHWKKKADFKGDTDWRKGQ